MKEGMLFLGTSGSMQSVVSKKRASGGLIIFINDVQLHVDPGPGALVYASHHNINFSNHQGVILTDSSIIHSGDANNILAAMGESGKHGKLYLTSENSLVAPESKQYVNETIQVEKYKQYSFYDAMLEFLESGFKIIDDKFSIHYVGNCNYSSKLAEDHQNASILIVNAFNKKDVVTKGKLNVDDIIKLIIATKPQLCVLTNFGDIPDSLSLAREIQRESKVQTIAAKDGLFVDPLHYNLSIRQKTLQHF